MVEEGKKTKKTNEKNTFVGGRLCKGEGEGCRPAMPKGRRRSREGGGRDGRSREGEGKSLKFYCLETQLKLIRLYYV